MNFSIETDWDSLKKMSAEPKLRCKLCERDWFQNGQPEWHFQTSQKSLEVL